MNGLDADYEAIVAIITSREEIPTIQYVHSTLLTHKGSIEHKKAFDRELSINYITNSGNKNQNRNQGSSSTATRNDQSYSRNEKNYLEILLEDIEVEEEDGITTTGQNAKSMRKWTHC